MVVFTCNTCSEVLKRNKVETHCYQCRGCESLSCVDCGKDFWGDDYQSHTKCISEEEKYGKKGTAPKVNKGEVKQDQWLEQVQAAIEKTTSKPRLKRLLESIKDCPNIPRKKAKFENFVKNSLKCYDTALVAASWDVLMTSKEQTQNENRPETVQENLTESASRINGVNNDDDHTDDVPKNKKEKKEERKKKSQKKEKKDKLVETLTENTSKHESKKSKKRKRQEIEEETITNGKNNGPDDGGKIKKNKKRKRCDLEDEEITNLENMGDDTKKSKKKNKRGDDSINTETSNGDDGADEDEEEPPTKKKKAKFDWAGVIRSVLEKKGELPLKKLKRKVLSEFAAQDAANYNEENLSGKFDKKVAKIEGVKVYKDRACLKT